MRIREVLSNASLIKKISVIFLLLVILPSILSCSLVYSGEKQRYIEQKVSASKAVVQTYARSIEANLIRVNETMRSLSTNSALLSLLANSNKSAYDRILLQSYDVNETLGVHMAMLADFDCLVSVYMRDESIAEIWFSLLHLSRIQDDEKFLAFQNSGALSAWQGMDTMYPILAAYQPYNPIRLILYRRIISGVKNEVGVIRCGVNISKLCSLPSTYTERGALYLLSEDGALYAKENSFSAAPAFTRESGSLWQDRTLSVFAYIEALDATLYLCMDSADILPDIWEAALPQILLLVCVTVVMMLVTVLAMRSFIKGLYDASRLTTRVREGDFSVRFSPRGQDEVGKLLSACNVLLDNMEISAKKLIEHEKNTREAQLRALQYQINPHFLFNTLSYLQMMVEKQAQRTGLSDAIAQLSDFMRYNMNASPYATLSQEQENMQNYVSLMSMRKGTAIALQTNWDDALDDMPIMRFMLQPILENAIQHGGAAGQPLSIDVSVTLKDGVVTARVQNDGTPIPDDQLAHLRSVLNDSSRSERIGLINVVTRLRLMYGPDAHIDVNSRDGNTEVRCCFRLLKPIDGGKYELFGR